MAEESERHPQPERVENAAKARREFTERVNGDIRFINGLISMYNQTKAPSHLTAIQVLLKRRLTQENTNLINENAAYRNMYQAVDIEVNKRLGDQSQDQSQDMNQIPSLPDHHSLYVECLELLVKIKPNTMNKREKDFIADQEDELYLASGDIEKLEKIKQLLTSIDKGDFTNLFTAYDQQLEQIASLNRDGKEDANVKKFIDKIKQEMLNISEVDQLSALVERLKQFPKYFNACSKHLSDIEGFKLGDNDHKMTEFIRQTRDAMWGAVGIEQLQDILGKLVDLRDDYHADYHGHDRGNQLEAIKQYKQEVDAGYYSEEVGKQIHFSKGISERITRRFDRLLNLSIKDRVSDRPQASLALDLDKFGQYKKDKEVCIALLKKIVATTDKFYQDEPMRQFLHRQNHEILRAKDLEDIQTVKADLEARLQNLTTTTDVIKEIVNTLRARANSERVTVGMRKKADRIEAALHAVPVEERNQISKAALDKNPQGKYSAQVLNVINELKRFRTISWKKESSSFGLFKDRMKKQVEAAERKESLGLGDNSPRKSR